MSHMFPDMITNHWVGLKLMSLRLGEALSIYWYGLKGTFMSAPWSALTVMTTFPFPNDASKSGDFCAVAMVVIPQFCFESYHLYVTGSLSRSLISFSLFYIPRAVSIAAICRSSTVQSELHTAKVPTYIIKNCSRSSVSRFLFHFTGSQRTFLVLPWGLLADVAHNRAS